MEIKVCKFGGTSLASAGQMKRVAEVVLADSQRKIIVVSAPGKRSSGDTKVTDLLTNFAVEITNGKSGENDLKAILNRFDEIIDELELLPEMKKVVVETIEKRCEEYKGKSNNFIDAIKALGEELNARIFAKYLSKFEEDVEYVDPREAGLLLSDEPGNARVLQQSYDKLKLLKNKKGRIVFPGFYGYSVEGKLVTFPRGGSDITGSVLAAAVSAAVYENFTDVDYIYSANPGVVDNPKPMYEVSYKEMRELSYCGFSVFQEEALEPCFRAGIPVQVRNTNNLKAEGTKIVSERSPEKCDVVGIASARGFCTIFLSKYLMNREKGFGRKLLQILEDEDISYEHMPSGIDNVSLIISEAQFNLEVEKRVTKRIEDELHPDSIAVQRGITLVVIVGEGMKESVGVAKRVITACAHAGVNLEMINQGSSEINIMLGIRSDYETTAVRALHKEFFEK